MGIGPVEAVPKALKLAGLEISDIGLFELNEAFASQSVQVINTLGLRSRKGKRKRWSYCSWSPTRYDGYKINVIYHA